MDPQEKRTSYLSELFSYINPSVFGEACRAAVEKGDLFAAMRPAADHFRKRAACPVAEFRGETCPEALLQQADRAVSGIMREVNIDWAFPDGNIQFLFNPTEAHPPLNHEWLWQLNRHSFWLAMACAYRATGNADYARAFNRQLLAWIDQTDIPENWNGPGSAWRTIECGIRLMSSWQTAFEVFRHAPEVSDEALLLMLAAMHRQAIHLAAHITSGNWLMMECNGIYCFASLFPEFSDAEALRTMSGRRLSEELARQVLPDGMHYELSPDYHLVVWHCASGMLTVAKACGRAEELPKAYPLLLRKLADAAVALSTPGFTQPRTNDCFTIFTEKITQQAAALFPDVPAYAFVNSRRAEGEAPKGETASRFLPWAGFCAMRTDWSAESTYACLDVGPVGYAHIHQDKLNLQIFKGREELLFDDGGGQYEESAARRYGISGFDHNIALVDGLPQCRTAPRISEAPIDAGWVSCDAFDFAEGTYADGFGAAEAHPATHHRAVRFCKPDFFCVTDELLSADGAEHTYELLFHMDTTVVEPIAEYPGAMLSNFGRTWDLLIVPLDTDAVSAVVSAQTEPRFMGWFVGRNAENLHPAATVIRKAAQAKAHRFVTLLFPIRRGEALPEIFYDGRDAVSVRFRGRSTQLSLHALNR